ncbi:MAG: TerC/Alx family metal homeostasis membrane protein [Candidatus Bathyarchaeota archaeon]|nr:TerC/Alx family metal homeostasis membrane protein [Candidatus Bathyarchaeota archaeon]
MEVSIQWWLMFHAAIVVMLLIDLITSKGKGKLTLRRDIIFSVIWISIGLAFGGIIFWEFGSEEGLKYITAYVTEKALSIDNLFVWIVIFTYFGVPFERQHKTLFYGILGAIVFRAAFIFAGVELIERFHGIVYVFGAILLYSSYKLLKGNVQQTNPANNPVVKLVKRFVPMCDYYDEDNFLTKVNGALVCTPLICVLLVIESTDILFALDSVPAVLTITGEFFTAYTSNIMAILGLRALYFVVAHAMGELKYLDKGLAIVLAYLGIKTFAGYFGVEVPTLWNMAIVLGTIAFFIVLSLVYKDKGEKKGEDHQMVH